MNWFSGYHLCAVSAVSAARAWGMGHEARGMGHGAWGMGNLSPCPAGAGARLSILKFQAGAPGPDDLQLTILIAGGLEQLACKTTAHNHRNHHSYDIRLPSPSATTPATTATGSPPTATTLATTATTIATAPQPQCWHQCWASMEHNQVIKFR